ncbi:MAG: TfoX/Sxy family protein [Bacteroidaceae bacterium]|nr:TfoX/Sxy family protein [Bacteroidaceae bacterium]
MASNQDLVQYIADQMSRAGEITFKRMFGEFGLYCEGKFFAMVCDDRLLFKPTEAGKVLLGTPVLLPPYPGAKPCYYIADVDDHELLVALTKATCRELPEPKVKKNKK